MHKNEEKPGFLYHGEEKKPFLAFTNPLMDVVLNACTGLVRQRLEKEGLLNESFVVIGVEVANNKKVATTQSNIGVGTILLVAFKKDAGMTRRINLGLLWRENSSLIDDVRENFPVAPEVKAA